MKTIIYLFSICFLIGTQLSAQTYTTLLTDQSGDGSNAMLLDGTELAVSYEPASDSLWFRIAVNNLSGINLNQLGVNLMINIPGGGATFNFWGQTNTAPYHKLLTFWVTGTAPSNYIGTIGISNAAGVNGSNYRNLHSNNLSARVSAAEGYIYLGMKRTDLITDAEMGGDKITLKVAAAVGSNTVWNDDLYDPSKNWELDKSSSPNVTGINVVEEAKVSVYPNPVSDVLTIRYTGVEVGTKLTLRSPAGRKIRESRIGTEENWDLSDFPAGIYLLEVHQEGQLLEYHRIVVF
ncbi:T9SS type A sorting domain-containing protein [bacterium SCSIO 12741]|nr:T9SS type A sorting domain-containing protein [bacterium SCSIO 12741]